MIDALIAGRLRGDPVARTAQNNRPFYTFHMTASDKKGEVHYISCVAFSTSAIDAVQRLRDGDSIAVSGELTVKEWNGQDGAIRRGFDVTAHAVLSAYHAGRKRLSAEASL